MIYYLLYPKDTYTNSCRKLQELGIRPAPTTDRSFYVHGELPDDTVAALSSHFKVEKRDAIAEREAERKRLLESEYRKFRNSEECQEMFSGFIERYNRDRAKVHAAMIEYFRQADRSELIEFLPQP